MENVTETNLDSAPVWDQVQRFLFDTAPVRGAFVQLKASWREVLARRDYPLPIKKVMGELAAAANLLISNLKFQGTLVLQIQGQGALQLVVIEANSDHTFRATAKWQADKVLPEGLHTLLGDEARFVMTLDPAQGEAWQGVVPLVGDSVAACLMHYMKQSEQLETHLQLSASDDEATGFLLQRLPEGQGDASAWENALVLAQTLKTEELQTLNPTAILHRLFHEETVRLFPAASIYFACSCSAERVGAMLKMLGKDDVDGIIAEQGSVAISCDFCHERYVFDEADVALIFSPDEMLAPSPTQKPTLQ
jgi:molecular chaperone Hsp33